MSGPKTVTDNSDILAPADAVTSRDGILLAQTTKGTPAPRTAQQPQITFVFLAPDFLVSAKGLSSLQNRCRFQLAGVNKIWNEMAISSLGDQVKEHLVTFKWSGQVQPFKGNPQTMSTIDLTDGRAATKLLRPHWAGTVDVPDLPVFLLSAGKTALGSGAQGYVLKGKGMTAVLLFVDSGGGGFTLLAHELHHVFWYFGRHHLQKGNIGAESKYSGLKTKVEQHRRLWRWATQKKFRQLQAGKP